MGRRHSRKDVERWLRRREREGLTYRELSRVSGIPIPTLSWWSRKLSEDAEGRRSGAPCELVPVEIVGDDSAAGAIEIHLGPSLRLLVPEGFSEAHLARVLRVLSSTC
jgi:transposase-like protein